MLQIWDVLDFLAHPNKFLDSGRQFYFVLGVQIANFYLLSASVDSGFASRLLLAILAANLAEAVKVAVPQNLFCD